MQLLYGNHGLKKITLIILLCCSFLDLRTTEFYSIHKLKKTTCYYSCRTMLLLFIALNFNYSLPSFIAISLLIFLIKVFLTHTDKFADTSDILLSRDSDKNFVCEYVYRPHVSILTKFWTHMLYGAKSRWTKSLNKWRPLSFSDTSWTA